MVSFMSDHVSTDITLLEVPQKVTHRPSLTLSGQDRSLSYSSSSWSVVRTRETRKNFFIPAARAMSESQTPTPANVDLAQIQLCLSLYPKVIEQHYTARVKDPKKRAEAISRDHWRYVDLPVAHAGGTGKPASTKLTLDVLERLVQWKITHGASRPFLPAMIRKNSPQSVIDVTSSVAAILAPILRDEKPSLDSHLETSLKALDAVSKLTGVGPATASLLLAIYSPMHIPFFEDEMFQWICSKTWKEKGGKLKYDKEEYAVLFRELWELRQRLGLNDLSAVDVEKAAFVIIHGGSSSGSEVGVDGAKEIVQGDEQISLSVIRSKKEPKGTKRGTPKPESDQKKEDETAAARRSSKRVKR